MEEFYEYLEVLLLISPLVCLIIALAFRLLDNSAFLFLQKEILIDSSYVSDKILRDQLSTSADFCFRKKIKRALAYRKMYKLFLSCTILALPVTFFSYWYLV